MQKWKSSRTQVTGCFSTLSPTVSGIAPFVPLRPLHPGSGFGADRSRDPKNVLGGPAWQLINCGIERLFLPFNWSILPSTAGEGSIDRLMVFDSNIIRLSLLQGLFIYFESSPCKSGDTRRWMERTRRISAHQCLGFQRMKWWRGDLRYLEFWKSFFAEVRAKLNSFRNAFAVPWDHFGSAGRGIAMSARCDYGPVQSRKSSLHLPSPLKGAQGLMYDVDEGTILHQFWWTSP